jgi:hypothetical protein
VHFLTAAFICSISAWWNPAMTADDRAVFAALPLLLLVVSSRVVLPLAVSLARRPVAGAVRASSVSFRGWDRVGYIIFLGAVMAALLALAFVLALPLYLALGMTAVVWDATVVSMLLVATAAGACLMTTAAFTISVISRSKDDIVDHFRAAVWPALAAAAFRL